MEIEYEDLLCCAKEESWQERRTESSKDTDKSQKYLCVHSFFIKYKVRQGQRQKVDLYVLIAYNIVSL